MNISRKSWYVRLFFLMSWFNAKAFEKQGPLEDPTDICPMVRMILLWGPLSIVFLLAKIAFVIFVILVVIGIIAGLGMTAASMSFWDVVTRILLFALALMGIIAALCCVGALIWGIVWCVRKVRQSAFATWWSKRFPPSDKPVKETARRSRRASAPKPPSGIRVFITWVDGQLHGWCSPLKIVD
jgi:hypothetical protein